MCSACGRVFAARGGPLSPPVGPLQADREAHRGLAHPSISAANPFLRQSLGRTHVFRRKRPNVHTSNALSDAHDADPGDTVEVGNLLLNLGRYRVVDADGRERHFATGFPAQGQRADVNVGIRE